MNALTSRQLEVALAIARGDKQEDIAKNLGITVDGVRYHSRTLRDKLGVTSARQIGKALVDQGFATPAEVFA